MSKPQKIRFIIHYVKSTKYDQVNLDLFITVHVYFGNY